MADKTKDSAPAKAATLTLKHSQPWDGELSIGEAQYDVKAGVVKVPPEAYEAAYQAGFRPAA
jgi:hypothetical protein